MRVLWVESVVGWFALCLDGEAGMSAVRGQTPLILAGASSTETDFQLGKIKVG